MSLGPDPITGAFTVIEEDHRIIHDARAFTTHYATELKKNETLDFVIRVPASCRAHVRGWHFWCQRNKELELTLYEDTLSTGGTPVPTRNNSRGGPDSKSTVVVDPTITDLGEEIDMQPIRESPSEHVLGSEWVLMPDTQYTLRVLNPAAKSRVTVRVFWYEPNEYAGGVAQT